MYLHSTIFKLLLSKFKDECSQLPNLHSTIFKLLLKNELTKLVDEKFTFYYI